MVGVDVSIKDLEILKAIFAKKAEGYTPVKPLMDAVGITDELEISDKLFILQKKGYVILVRGEGGLHNVKLTPEGREILRSEEAQTLLKKQKD